ncbi:MAG: chemotaxis protein CheW [Candidatus Rokubacteria bacterium]|nr:chemotaxis protein CheW [Candidatus Rokubacteria bacterium]
MEPLRSPSDPIPAASPGGIGQYVVFTLGTSEFAAPIEAVQEILVFGRVTLVPNVPAFIEGVINVRGKVIPVINLARRFGMPGKPWGPETRTVVVEVGEQTVGMIVDSVTEVIKLPPSAIEPPPPLITLVASRFLLGVGKLGERIVVLLNLDRVLSADELLDLARAGSEAAPAQLAASHA